MVKKITLYLFVLLSSSVCLAQLDFPVNEYNGFSSRSFLKFNNFLTVPTFSLLNTESRTIEAISRSSNILFEDAPRLHVLSYSGRMRENVGAGVLIFQQKIGVFRDYGAIANYAYQVRLGEESKLTFGMNFFYSRRGLNNPGVISKDAEEVVNNFQEIPAVVFQPAATVSFGKVYAGVFLENLADFNLKRGEFITSFSEKTISLHGGYNTGFEGMSGILTDTSMSFLGVLRRSNTEGFTYGGNVLVNLPRAGWVKLGYDKTFGLNAGLGVNLSEKLSVGFSYEKQKNLGATNEVGLIYDFGGKRSYREPDSTPEVKVVLPGNESENNNPRNGAQDSIRRLNKKVDEILRLLKNQPEPAKNNTVIIRDTVRVKTQTDPVVIRDTVRIKTPSNPVIIRDTIRVESEEKDMSLRRSTATPWREKTITRRGTGGGGTAYYVAVDMFSDAAKAKKSVNKYKRKKVNARYVRDPKTKKYFVYLNRFSKEEDAERVVKEINGGKKGFENDEANDLGIKVKSVSKDPVYVMKITFEGEGESYKEPKSQPPARVRTMKLIKGLEPGYYLTVNVFSKKAYADKFLDELRADNIDANYFINPKTGYRHVYVLKTDDRSEIIRLYDNNLNGSYYDSKSIIHIR